ncbi:MAG: ribosome recycling factor [Candidatus Levybacteria bacterium RIFCSPLOWO2_01_FULL_39_24]|nr:MAG: ribosome recycling factor [Candidatus Levybacteria bacterium RIFCSPHIGHO2_01_FULL_40_16]OGH28221.1 MAG: ribosome recycling factor [Candidatus Levybacteria bacterium RIFCSPHIGHO2_12_FULL_39_9]OGH46656.1 MAG: ribosome recycling factor [Candidatus Levybacteria bacterium RIFCSPLOWO2_01_FULL_39_24]
MDDTVSQMRARMQKALMALQEDLSTVRTGRAMPSLVENVVVSVYAGAQRLRIKELATISASDPQTLVLQPFDGSITGEIQKGIMEANIGLTPSSDGNVIRISIPPLSQERRGELIKLMKQKLENGRIAIRQIRQDARNIVRKQHNNKEISEEQMYGIDQEIQKITDQIMLPVDEMGRKKEAELMQI